MGTIAPPATPTRDGVRRLIEEARSTGQPTPLTRPNVLKINGPGTSEFYPKERTELYDELFRKLGVTQERIGECVLEHTHDGRLSGHHEVTACDSLSVFVHGRNDKPGFDLYLAPAGYRQT